MTHGLAGVGLVGLVIAHVYFAVRPEKWWITKSMILGWITRRQYLEHHEPERWRVAANPPTSRYVTGDTTHRPGMLLAARTGRRGAGRFAARCNAIEEAYEFMLAYAAQGLPHEHGSTSGSQIRELPAQVRTRRSTGLADAVTHCVRRLGIESPAPYDAFVSVLERDARSAQAAVQLVLAQPSIGSQLVDNLNASIHLRAVLTDLFLLDEVLKA